MRGSTNNILEQARLGNMDSAMMSNKAKVGTSSVRVKSSAIERAEEIRANLSPEFPSFSKPVIKSHVSLRFRLNLHRQICKAHLPNHDCPVVLEDENGQEYPAKYSVQRNLITVGWREFSKAHKLREGDALIFHLIDHCKFKVYIVRATEADRALALLNSDFHDDELVSDSENFSPDIPETPKFSDEFKNVKGFEDFKIIVSGLVLDSEILTHIRKKYYELCCSQTMFLHENLIEGLNTKLAVNMISETITIVDAIRAANIATSLHHLKCWDKTLEGFEVLGMSVGFLRARVRKLIGLSCDSKAIIELKSVKKARLDDEIEALKASILKVKELMDGLEGELVALEVKNEKLGFEFVELAGAI